MVVNDNAGILTPRSVLKSIASRLAPTEKHSGVPTMVVNDNAGESDTPQCSQVHREQARSYGKARPATLLFTTHQAER